MASVPNVIPFAANESGSDLTSLLLKYYTGKFDEAARQQPVLFGTRSPVIDYVSAPHGKSWQNLVQADLPDPEVYTSGEEPRGQKFATDEIVSTLDETFIVHHFMPKDKRLEAHFEEIDRIVPGQYRKMGNWFDGRIFRTAVLSARTGSATKHGLTVHNGGNRVTNTGGAVATRYPLSPIGAQNLRQDMRLLYQRMLEDNLMPGSFYMWMTPYLQNVLKNDGAYVWGTPSNAAASADSTLFSREYGSQNDLNKSVIAEVDGWKIVGFPNTSTNGGPLPDEDFTTNGKDSNSKFQGVFAASGTGGVGAPCCLALASGMGGQAAVQILEHRPLEPFMVYDELKDGWTFGVRGRYGINKLHPWCAGTIEVTTS